MSNEHKNFEDRLKNRLHNEELQYEAGAWEKFQELNNIGGIAKMDMDENPEKKNNRRGFWIPIFLLVCFSTIAVLAGKWSINQLGDDIIKNETSNLEDKQILDKKSIFEKGEDSNSNLLASQKSQLNINKVDNLQAQNHEKPSIASDEIAEIASSTSIEKSNGNPNHAVASENRHFELVNKSAKSTKIKNPSNSDLFNGDGFEQPKSQEVEKGFDSTESQELLHFITPSKPTNPSINVNQDVAIPIESVLQKPIAKNEDSAIDRNVLIANIGDIDIKDPTHQANLEFDLDVFVEPLKYKKNEFYFGAGYANKFSEFSLKNAVGEGTQKYPTYWSMGYFRKTSPSWSYGLEISLSHIRELPLSRKIEDYHQISTRFEFISGVMKHRATYYAGTSILAKYQPLFSRLGLYGGVNVAYAYGKSTSFRNDFEGVNSVIEELRVFHTGTAFYKNLDYGLIAGVSFKIWKGLELEGRAVLGLADVSEDYYWGEGRTTTTHYRLGLKFRIL